MRSVGFCIALLFLIAACLPNNNAKAGSVTSCAGATVASCAGSVASCSGSSEAKIRRTPVRSLFASMKERRAERVSARQSASCSGSTATKLETLCE